MHDPNETRAPVDQAGDAPLAREVSDPAEVRATIQGLEQFADIIEDIRTGRHVPRDIFLKVLEMLEPEEFRDDDAEDNHRSRVKQHFFEAFGIYENHHRESFNRLGRKKSFPWRHTHYNYLTRDEELLAVLPEFFYPGVDYLWAKALPLYVSIAVARKFGIKPEKRSTKTKGYTLEVWPAFGQYPGEQAAKHFDISPRTWERFLIQLGVSRFILYTGRRGGPRPVVFQGKRRHKPIYLLNKVRVWRLGQWDWYWNKEHQDYLPYIKPDLARKAVLKPRLLTAFSEPQY